MQETSGKCNAWRRSWSPTSRGNRRDGKTKWRQDWPCSWDRVAATAMEQLRWETKCTRLHEYEERATTQACQHCRSLSRTHCSSLHTVRWYELSCETSEVADVCSAGRIMTSSYLFNKVSEILLNDKIHWSPNETVEWTKCWATLKYSIRQKIISPNLNKRICANAYVIEGSEILTICWEELGSSKLFVKYVKNHEKMNIAVDGRRRTSAVSDVISITQQGRMERNAWRAKGCLQEDCGDRTLIRMLLGKENSRADRRRNKIVSVQKKEPQVFKCSTKNLRCSNFFCHFVKGWLSSSLATGWDWRLWSVLCLVWQVWQPCLRGNQSEWFVFSR